jgi:hypothetical protein
MTSMPRGPIFVGGLERSGTSLMFALLASHPNIAMTRRTNLWTHFYGQYGDLEEDANLDRCLDAMMRYRRLRKLEPDRERLRREVRTAPSTYARLFALLEEQHASKLGKQRWGDKSLNTERYADAIIDAYPGARIVHMMRDPRDRYASSKTRWDRRGGIGAGTAEWLDSAERAERNARLYPENVLVVRYEDLVTDPIDGVRRVCEFVDEPYMPEMLELGGAPVFRDKGANSSYGERRAGEISTNSVGRYRSVLSPTEVEFVRVVAAEAMERFGYEPAAQHLHMMQRACFVAWSLPWETCRLVAWRARENMRDRRGRPVPLYRLIEPDVVT